MEIADMGKKVWIVNYYCPPPEYNSNTRHLGFTHYLQASGYDVTLFTSGFLNRGEGIDLVPADKEYAEVLYGEYKYVHIKTNRYKGNGLARMKSIYTFAHRLKRLRKHFDKPDVVIQNMHAPFDYQVCKMAKQLHARYIAEAWDLWPYDFVTFGLISGKNPIMKWAYGIERKMYESASDIVFSFEGGLDYLRWHKWTTEGGGRINPNKVHYINNGLDVAAFDKNVAEHPNADPDLHDQTKFRIVYMGSIRLANNLIQLIDAASILKTDPKFSFLIYGNGSDKPMLQQYCIDNHIDNVIFKSDWIPYEEVAYVVSQSSLNVLNYHKGFGVHGISSGKFFQYLAAGKPIVSNIKLNYSDIERYNLGIDAELDTPEKYAAAIRQIANMSRSDYDAMCKRVRATVDKYDYKVLSERLIDVLEKNCYRNMEN